MIAYLMLSDVGSDVGSGVELEQCVVSAKIWETCACSSDGHYRRENV